MINLNELNIAVTGASGFVGERLVNHLISLGVNVSILVRDKESVIYNDQKQVTVFEGDLSNPEVLTSFINNCDVVYHLAAYVHKPTVTHDQIESCYEINYLGTKRLIDVCVKKSPAPFFVLFSTTAVYGNIGDIKVESQQCIPTTEYGKTKLAAENYLLSKIGAGELRGCIVRPSSIIGENAPGNLSKMIKMIDLGIIPSFNGGVNRKSMAFVDNVIQGAILIIENKEISNQQIYNIADPDPVQMKEIIQIIGNTLEKKPLVVNIPRTPVLALSAIWDKFARLFQGKLPLLKRSLEVYTSEDVINTHKIQKQLGYYPIVSVREGVTRMVKAYKKS